MPIANFFIKKILSAYRELNHYDEDDIDLIRYGLEAVLWEIEKLIYIAVIFAVIGQWWQFLACAVVIMTVRPMSGGFHASTPWRCFGWTLLGFVLATTALPLLITLNNTLIVALAVFSLISNLIAAPTRSDQMERIANKVKDKYKKSLSVVVTAIWFIVLFIHQEHFLATSAIWAVYLQSLQLIITWASKRKYIKV